MIAVKDFLKKTTALVGGKKVVKMRREGCNEPVLQKIIWGLNEKCTNTFDTNCPNYKTWNSLIKKNG